jgi:hypothetical protein
VRLFPGNYSAWRERRAAEAAGEQQARRDEQGRAQRAAARDGRAAGQPARRARNPWRLAQLEERIFELEGEQKQLHADCAREEVFRDPARLKAASQRLSAVEAELAAAYEEWESFADPA